MFTYVVYVYGPIKPIVGFKFFMRMYVCKCVMHINILVELSRMSPP